MHAPIRVLSGLGATVMLLNADLTPAHRFALALGAFRDLAAVPTAAPPLRLAPELARRMA